MYKFIKGRWPEILVLLFFCTLVVCAISAPFFFDCLNDPKYAAAINVSLSIGTSGLVAFIFYYVVNERLERGRRQRLRASTLTAYRQAKESIAFSIIHASRKGGRTDLTADYETVEKMMTVTGFKNLFSGGRESTEGFYAFQNQMSERSSEYDEIIFNLEIIGRAVNRLIDSNFIDNEKYYNLFVRLDSMLRRIERNGPGYDESKPLCRFILEIFSGWNFVNGDVGHDPVEEAIKSA